MSPHAYALLTWFSPSFPTGGFSYAHGLEAAVDAGAVRDAAGLRAYAETVLLRGNGLADGVLFAEAHRAAAAADAGRLAAVAELAAAWRGTAELALESAAQGRAFLATVRAVRPAPVLDALDALCRERRIDPAHAVAAAVACAARGVPEDDGLLAYLHAFAGLLVSAGLRLVPLGQTDGQRVTAALEPVVAEAVARGLTTDVGDAAPSSPMIDLFSMAHETQRTRLFRS